MIASQVSILLTRVLEGAGQISLVATYQKAKGKSVCMKPWCKQKVAIFTIEISSEDLINKACSKYTHNRCCISHNHLKSLH